MPSSICLDVRHDRIAFEENTDCSKSHNIHQKMPLSGPNSLITQPMELVFTGILFSITIPAVVFTGII